LECSPLGRVEEVPYDFKSKERGFVGTALVAVRFKVRTGTSPVPTKHILFETGFSTHPLGAVEKVLLRGGMNSRQYGKHELISHRAGHLALLIRFFNSPYRFR